MWGLVEMLIRRCCKMECVLNCVDGWCECLLLGNRFVWVLGFIFLVKVMGGKNEILGD